MSETYCYTTIPNIIILHLMLLILLITDITFEDMFIYLLPNN